MSETIRYAWSGTDGDPLTYEYNGSSSVKLAPAIKQFSFTYQTRSVKAPVPPPPNGADRLLMVMTNTILPNGEELARQTLFESWGYTVTRIDDNDAQVNYDTALTENDVVYVSEKVNATSLGTKLVGATIGVVSEEAGLVDEFGFASEYAGLTGSTLEIADNQHYITADFALGPLAVVATGQPMTSLGGTLSADLQALGQWGAEAGLAVLDKGDALQAGGTVAGRRVAMPWASGSFSTGQLTDDGRTLVRRAIEWAGGAAAVDTPQGILLVVKNPGSLTSQETARQALIESWGYTVTLIDDNDTQANYDTAVGNVDAAYVSEEVDATSLGTKLKDKSIGIVIEDKQSMIDYGFGTGQVATSATSTEIIDSSHYITETLGLGTLSILDSTQPLIVIQGYPPAGAATLAQGPGQAIYEELVAIESGGALAGGGNAVGRRVKLPWGDDSFDFTALNANGQTLMQRAIQWALGDDLDNNAPNTGIVFEEFTQAKTSVTVTSLMMDLPPGTAAGDLLVAALALDGGPLPVNAPFGWNQLAVQTNNSRVTLGIWWKIADGSEIPLQTFSWWTNETAFGWMMRFTGHDPDNPISTFASSANASSSPTCPAVTTTSTDTMILRIGGFDDGDVTLGDAGMAGHTTIVMDESGSSTGDCSGGAAYTMQGTAGDSGAANFTLTASEEYVTVTIAIEPAP
ncbi:MAG: hypothetical protein KDB14_11990 [Planctomycetales bacterium]|nr:hypothetical protein [Planctomycetales bacterium]